MKARRTGQLTDLEAALALHVEEAETCERREWQAHNHEQSMLRHYIAVIKARETK